MFKELVITLRMALTLWNTKESRKYMDEVIRLEKDKYEEENKYRPDHAVIDNLDFRLLTLSKAINSDFKKSNS